MSNTTIYTRREFLEYYVINGGESVILTEIAKACEYGLEPKKDISISYRNKILIAIKG